MRKLKKRRKFKLSPHLKDVAAHVKNFWDLDRKKEIRAILVKLAQEAQLSVKLGHEKEFMVTFKKELG